MKISVITVVKNAQRTVVETVASVKKQDYPDVEHLVVDGGSTDGTVDVLLQSGFPAERLLCHQDRGVYEGFNHGLQAATGNVVGFLNGDDVFEHEGVLSLVARQFKAGQVNAVYGDLVYVQRSDITRVVRYWNSGVASPGRIRCGWMPPHPTVYLDKSLVDLLGPYDEGLKISGDYEYFLRMSRLSNLRLAYIPSVLVRMRAGGLSNWPPQNHIKKWKEDLFAIRRHGIGGFPSLLAKNFRKIPQAFRLARVASRLERRMFKLGC